MRFLVPLVAALVPLLITPGLLSYFDVTPKIAILLFGVSLMLLYSSANISNVRNLLRAPAGRWFAGLIGLTWIVSALATVFSTYPVLSLDGGNWRRYGFIVESGLLIFTLLAAAWLAADHNNVRILLRACVASGGLAALYGIAQYFGWDPWLPAAAYQAGEGPFTIVRPPGTLGHADYFAAWLVIVAFFGLALARLEQARWPRLAALGVSILSIVAIVLSGTRSAVLGLLAGALVLTFLNRPRIRWRAVMIGVVVAACSVIFWFTPAGTKLRARAHWSSEDAWGGARLLLWRDSLHMARYHPLIGFGPEDFATEFPRFESADLARAYPDFYHESPHNIFLDALTTRGASGLLLLLGFCGLAIWVITRRKRPELAAALVASLVCQQFTVFVVPTALYFYLLIALLVTRPANAVPESRRARWLLPVAVAASLASLMFAAFAVRLVVADRALAVVFQRIESGDASGAAKEYQLVLRWEPQGTGADLNYSRAMTELAARTPVLATRVQATQQATEAAIRATRTAEDRYNAWYNLAKLLAGQNNLAGVEQSLRNAIAWAPNWFKPHWVLAQLLEVSHRHQQAVAEAEVAFDLDGGRDPEVSETWRKLQQSSDPQPKTGSQP
ncbi:MAG TPA: O-antigen ligase family protein [Bryobacteraceae bacterium]|nr:O-antigen ligase family protein [Bryobacteraceae bacterium]